MKTADGKEEFLFNGIRVLSSEASYNIGNTYDVFNAAGEYRGTIQRYKTSGLFSSSRTGPGEDLFQLFPNMAQAAIATDKN